MTSPLLSRLTLAAALAFGVVTFAKADEAKQPLLDKTPTGSIALQKTLSVADTCSAQTRNAANDGTCRINLANGARYPVNALEGMNLGW
jgi:hypothetical protein